MNTRERLEFILLSRFSLVTDSSFTGYEKLLVVESDGRKTVLTLRQVAPDALGQKSAANVILLSSPITLKSIGPLKLSVSYALSDQGPCSQDHDDSIGNVSAQ